MEDNRQLTQSRLPIADAYRCPGESYTIDRAVHLGRLAAFYPACRGCVHRHETHTLSPLEIGQWAEIGRNDDGGPRFTSETLAAKSANEMHAAIVRQFAGALGGALWRDEPARPKPPTVLIASDGHWTTAELVAAACEALRLAGCRAIEAGAATSAAVASGGRRLQTDVALWMGNASGEPHASALKLWGSGGVPWSSPGRLDRVREIYHAKIDRPQRRGGGLERVHLEEDYLAPFHSLFHALRPLRMVVDTSCDPFLRFLNTLVSQAACEVVQPGQAPDPTGRWDSPSVPGGLSAVANKSRPWVERRLVAVGRQVVAAGAHFGLWIDGDAEACHLVDECGSRVDSQRLLLLLAKTVCAQRPDAVLVLERGADAELDAALARWGARALRAEPTRQAMCEAMQANSAVMGGGPSGRLWFSGEPPAADVLLTVSLLLTILSESDRPLSEVLDAV